LYFFFPFSKWTQVVLGLKLLFIACDGLHFSGISDKPILAQIIQEKNPSNECKFDTLNHTFFLKPNPGVIINASKKLVETFDFTKNNLIFIPIWYGKSFRLIICS